MKGQVGAPDEAGSSGTALDKNLQVVCFNCGEIGHLSSACSKPRACFICQSTNHVVDLCPEWKKPPIAAQYYGSANRGLGFFFIDVEPRGNRFNHWNGLDNFGLLKIEEGSIDEEGIVMNLKELFGESWPWQLRKSGEGKYIIRFPPDRRVEKLVIGKTTLFYLNKGVIVASLSVWNADIEPLGSLTEFRVQITRIPPKWVDWATLRDVASGIGMMIVVDWHFLFNSFFSLARVKLLCKNPTKIPKDRIFVFGSKLFRVSFEPEGFEQKELAPDDGSEKGDDDTDPEEEDLLDDEMLGNPDGKGHDPTKGGSSANGSSESVHPSGGAQGNNTNHGGGTSVRRVLLFDEIFQADKDQELECVDLLKAMELEDVVGDDITVEQIVIDLIGQDDSDKEGAKMVNLPNEWVYDL